MRKEEGWGEKRIDRRKGIGEKKGWDRKREEGRFRDFGFSCKILEAFYAISHPMSEHIFFLFISRKYYEVSFIFLHSIYIYGIYIYFFF